MEIPRAGSASEDSVTLSPLVRQELASEDVESVS